MARDKVELLGHVTLTSGRLVFVDMGLVGAWSAVEPPGPSRAELGPVLARQVLPLHDFAIQGPDADAAGDALALQWDPRRLYDIPENRVQALRARFTEVVRAGRLRARLVESVRTGCRARAQRALRERGAGQVFFQGIDAFVLGGLPRNDRLPVFGVRTRRGAWSEVFLELRPGTRGPRTRLGLLSNQWDRVLLADLDALDLWQQDTPLDGRADLVFWGPDARSTARAEQAPRHGSAWGWADLPWREARRRAGRLEQLARRLEVDLRPHSHHWRVLEDARRSPMASATLSLGDGEVCGLLAPGARALPEVFCEHTPRGAMVRVGVGLDEKALASQD